MIRQLFLLKVKPKTQSLHQRVMVYDYDSAGYDIHKAANDPQLVDLATAYFQTAFELFKSHKYQLPPQQF